MELKMPFGKKTAGDSASSRELLQKEEAITSKKIAILEKRIDELTKTLTSLSQQYEAKAGKCALLREDSPEYRAVRTQALSLEPRIRSLDQQLTLLNRALEENIHYQTLLQEGIVTQELKELVPDISRSEALMSWISDESRSVTGDVTAFDSSVRAYSGSIEEGRIAERSDQESSFDARVANHRKNFSPVPKMEEEAQIEGAQIEKAQIEGVQIEGAQIEGAQVEGAQIEEAQIEGTQIEEPPLTAQDTVADAWKYAKALVDARVRSQKEAAVMPASGSETSGQKSVGPETVGSEAAGPEKSRAEANTRQPEAGAPAENRSWPSARRGAAPIFARKDGGFTAKNERQPGEGTMPPGENEAPSAKRTAPIISLKGINRSASDREKSGSPETAGEKAETAKEADRPLNAEENPKSEESERERVARIFGVKLVQETE